MHIVQLDSESTARSCAEIMSTSEPWVTFGRTFDESLAIIRSPLRETYVAVDDSGVLGFVIISMQGDFVGYIRSVAVRADQRRNGVGSRLVQFAEERILRESPNVFICVSSFNTRAKALYERLGYAVVGEMPDFVMRGYSEWLLRKSTGPLTGFKQSSA